MSMKAREEMQLMEKRLHELESIQIERMQNERLAGIEEFLVLLDKKLDTLLETISKGINVQLPKIELPTPEMAAKKIFEENVDFIPKIDISTLTIKSKEDSKTVIEMNTDLGSLELGTLDEIVEKPDGILCEFGCGKPATVQLKNGKWACIKNFRTCPGFKDKVYKIRSKVNGEEK